MTNSRYGFYLLPPYRIAREIAEIHTMLEKQYGFKAAGRFQVHCPIKGFFKKRDEPITTLVNELDILLKDEKPLAVEINGVISTHESIVLDLSRLRDAYNQSFAEFRERIVDVIRPYIAPDCDFIEDDLGNPFMGHITLAFRDSPNELHEHILHWLVKAPVPSGLFMAKSFHFLEFYSDDWDRCWWETLTWKLHKSWVLT